MRVEAADETRVVLTEDPHGLVGELVADPTKPRAMHEGAPGVALAVASGVATANVGAYLPYVDAYLVGTGIERELGVLDRTRRRGSRRRSTPSRREHVDHAGRPTGDDLVLRPEHPPGA